MFGANIMKKILSVFFATTALSASLHAAAAEHPTMLLYIQPFEYANSIKLSSYYGEYWFSQGNMVETLAKTKLSQAYGDVSMCEGNQSGKTLVWLQPKMFYNPLMRAFYAKVTANAYTGVGKLLGSYVGESTQLGHLDIKPEIAMNKAYSAALTDMTAKMQADSSLQTAANSASAASSADTPCSMVTLLPTPKLIIQ
jgi:hypothetical protein